MPDSPWYTKYAQVYTQWGPLDDKYQAAQGLGSQVRFDPNQGLIAGEQVDALGQVTTPGKVMMTPDEYQTYISLDRQLGDLENEFQTSGGGGSLDDAIKRATFGYNSDPRNIDAENAAKKYGREMDVRQQATSLANNQLQQQSADQKDATKSYNDFVSSPSWGQTFQAPQTNLPSADQLFERAVAAVKKGLPDVPDAPYYSGGLPGAGSMPSLGAARTRATADAAATSAANAAKQTWSSIGSDAPNPLVDQPSSSGAFGRSMSTNPWDARAPLNTSAPPPLNPWDARSSSQPPIPNNRPKVGFRGSLLYGR